MQSVENLQQAVQGRRLECLGVLVVVIPGTNTTLWDQRNDKVQAQQPKIVDCEVEKKVYQGQQQNKDYGHSVSRVSKHGYVLLPRGLEGTGRRSMRWRRGGIDLASMV